MVFMSLSLCSCYRTKALDPATVAECTPAVLLGRGQGQSRWHAHRRGLLPKCLSHNMGIDPGTGPASGKKKLVGPCCGPRTRFRSTLTHLGFSVFEMVLCKPCRARAPCVGDSMTKPVP